MQLAPLTITSLLVLAMLTDDARADGEVTVRGVYYKERSTRVIQPMLDTNLEIGADGEFRGHMLIDTVTSASAAAGAAGQAFTETRNEAGGSYLRHFGPLRVGAGGRYSSEPDYQSRILNIRAESDFAQRNTTLGINIARGFDRIDNSGAQGGLSSLRRGNLDTTLVSVSAMQVLSPVSTISVSYDAAYLAGFQQNIYRTVIAGGVITPERVPETRLRHAIATTLRYYLDPTGTTLVGGYRFYTDDWGIFSHAPEIRAIQEWLQENLELHLSYRYYRQHAADFYKKIYDSNDMTVEPFVTADDKLGEVRSHNLGIKTSVTLDLFDLPVAWSQIRVEAALQYLKQNTSYGDAVISHVAIHFPIEY